MYFSFLPHERFQYLRLETVDDVFFVTCLDKNFYEISDFDQVVFMNYPRIERYKEEQASLRSESSNVSFFMKKFDQKSDSELRQIVSEKVSYTKDAREAAKKILDQRVE